MSDVCKACGNNVYGNKISCPVCGAALGNKGVQARANQNISYTYNNQTSKNTKTHTQSVANQEEGSGFGWGVLSFFLPLVGVILFFVLRASRPNGANAAIIGAILGFFIWNFII